jgi:hypothetical protein
MIGNDAVNNTEAETGTPIFRGIERFKNVWLMNKRDAWTTIAHAKF